MIIKRNTLPILQNIFTRISNTKFDINTQYKLLKIKKVIEEEEEYYIEQLNLLKEYCLKDEKGQLILSEDGGYAIDKDKKEECLQMVEKINAIQIQMPDIYFSLEELEPLNLTFNELEALEPFIKF